MKDRKTLPFVCRFEGTTARKSEQRIPHFSNSAKRVNTNRQMNRQQSATLSNNLEALC
jgi:hypothetical protein